MATEPKHPNAVWLIESLLLRSPEGLRRAVHLMRTLFTPATLPLAWSDDQGTPILWTRFLMMRLSDQTPEDDPLVLASALQVFLDAADAQCLGFTSSQAQGLVGANYLLNRPALGEETPLIACLRRGNNLLATAFLSLSPNKYALRIEAVETNASDTDTYSVAGSDALHVALLPVPASDAVIRALIDRTSDINDGSPLAMAGRYRNVEALLYLLRTRWMDLDYCAPYVTEREPGSREEISAEPWEFLFSAGFAPSPPDPRVAAAWDHAIAALAQLRSSCAQLLLNRWGIPADLSNIVFAYLLANPPGAIPPAPVLERLATT